MTSPVDRHYTPTWLADEMVGLLPSSVTSVVDLAAGGGSLLKAAERRFGDGLVVGAADIDPVAVRLLRAQMPSWTVSRADSLSARSLSASSVYKRRSHGYDAGVLNPPFSYRGGRRLFVTYVNARYAVTPATAFVARALENTTPSGVVVAVLPENVMNIRGDAELWARWMREYELQVVRPLDRYTFRNVRSTSMLIRLDQSRSPLTNIHLSARERDVRPVRSPSLGCTCVQIVRGRVPVHRLSVHLTEQGAKFVHSTSIRCGAVSFDGPVLDRGLATWGPMVVFPRVGAPSRTKLSILGPKPIVLSDCVLGVRPNSTDMLEVVRRTIFEDFESFAAQYVGSCAPYLTVERLRRWLVSRGLEAVQARASDSPGTCDCATSETALA